MPLRKPIILVVLIALAGLVVYVLAASRSGPPVALNVVSVTEGNGTKRVTLGFTRVDAAARFEPGLELRVHANNQWQPALSLSEIHVSALLNQTNSHQLVFEFPRQTDRCRLSFGYRVGGSPFCKMYYFLGRHGISREFPALSKTIMKCTPVKPMLRHFESELEIPAGTPNPIAAVDTPSMTDLPVVQYAQRAAEQQR
jgi:hypothetical protein